MTPTTLLALGGKKGFYFEFEAKKQKPMEHFSEHTGRDRGRRRTTT
jgi:hypothetical protein